MVGIKRWIGVQEEKVYAAYTELLSENAAATDTHIDVTETLASTNFAVGMSIRIEDSADSEENEVVALPGGDVITTKTPLANNYTTARGAKVTILPWKNADLLSANTDMSGQPTQIFVTAAIAATYYKVGMSIRIQDTAGFETNIVAELPGADEITLRTALVNNYTTARSARIIVLPSNYMPYRTLDVQPGQNPIDTAESDERIKTGYMFGGFVGTGTMALTGRPDNIGWFLKWVMGAVAAGVPVGTEDLTAQANSDQKVCAVDDGSSFAEGDSVKISDATTYEYNEIDTIAVNNLTMVYDLQNTYVLASGQVDINVWKHRYTMGETIKSFMMEECVGISGQLGRFLVGNVVKRITLESTMGSPLLVTIELQNNTEILLTQSTLGSLPSVRAFALHDAVATLVGTVKAESIRINIENTIPDDAHTSGSRLLPDVALEGFSINGELELRFEDWDERRLFYGATVSEPVTPQDEVRLHALSGIWPGAPTGDPTEPYYKLDVNLPAVMITENPVTTTQRERLKQRVTFEAVKHASNYIDLYNKVESYNGVV